MLITCPQCDGKYEVPERFYGKKFYCPKCKTKVRTKPVVVADVPATLESSDSGQNTPDPPPRARRGVSFQKETRHRPMLSALTVQRIAMAIGLVGIAAIFLVFVNTMANTPTSDRDPHAPNGAGAAAVESDGASGEQFAGTNDGQRDAAGERRSNGGREATTGARSSLVNSQSGPTGSGRAGAEADPNDAVPADAFSAGFPKVARRLAGGGLLGPIPNLDITWDTNGPGYSLRLLDSRPLSGMAMEKIVRTYGSDAFLERYRKLLDTPDYSVRFYAALGLANFGQADERSISILLNAMALSRSRHAYRLRVDLANRLMNAYRPLVVPALTRLLSDEESEVRGFALEYLALLGRDSREAIPAMAELVNQRDLYVPVNESEFHTLKIGELARASLYRLAPYAKDAIPVLLEKAQAEEDINVRQAILDLGKNIASHAREAQSMEWPVWARNYGLPLLPKDAQNVMAFRMSDLRKIGFDRSPSMARVLDDLSENVFSEMDQVDLITIATYGRGTSLWERQPFVAVIRFTSADAIDRVPLSPERQVQGQRVRLVSPELVWQRVGERTLVVGTLAEIVTVLRDAKSSSGPRRLVIPERVQEPAFVACSPSQSTALYLAPDGSTQGQVEYEFWLEPLAIDAEVTSEKTPPTKTAVAGPPDDAARWWDDQLARPDAQRRRNDTRLVFSFSVDDATARQCNWLPPLPWEPSDGKALAAWQAFQRGLRIERAPYATATGLVRPELGRVNDDDRDAINEIIRWCLAEEQIGPTTRLAMGVEDRGNRLSWARYAAKWADLETARALVHLLNAMQLDGNAATEVLLELKSPRALAWIAEFTSRQGNGDISKENLQRLIGRVSHDLAIEVPESLAACVALCERHPGLAQAVYSQLEELKQSDRMAASSGELAERLQSILNRESTFRLPESDYEKMDEYASDSGMANAGLTWNMKLRGAPPTIKRLEPYLHHARTFEVLLPYVHPDLVSVEMDGPVDQDSQDYARIDGLRYFVARGDVVTVRRQRCDADVVADDWAATSDYLADELVRDEAVTSGSADSADNAVSSGATFDRYRLYRSQGVPKGQRVMIQGGWLYEVRWIGRNYSLFPVHSRDILMSLKPRAIEASTSDEGASETDSEIPASASPQINAARPQAKLNAPGDSKASVEKDH